MRLAARRLLALVVAVLISVAVGTFLPRPFARSAHGGVTVPPRRILVLSNAIHTDIAIPLARDTRASFAFLARSGLPVDNPGARWLVVGWGGRAFYIETPSWSDLKPLPVFRALTIDGSVLHVGLSGPIDRTDSAVTAFDLDEGGFDRLISYVLASFALRPEEAAAIPEVGYGQYDRFFEAKGYFNALFGCNTWTAGALRAAGLRTGLWNPTPQTLRLSLSMFN